MNGDRASGRFKPNSDTKLPAAKPDLDNLDKLVLDALEGIVFHNDSQAVQQCIQKSCDRMPPFSGRTDVIVRRAPEDCATNHTFH